MKIVASVFAKKDKIVRENERTDLALLDHEKSQFSFPVLNGKSMSNIGNESANPKGA